MRRWRALPDGSRSGSTTNVQLAASIRFDCFSPASRTIHEPTSSTPDPYLSICHLPITSAGQAPVLSERSKRFINVLHQPVLRDGCSRALHACMHTLGLEMHLHDLRLFLLYFSFVRDHQHHCERLSADVINPKLIHNHTKNGRIRT